MTRREKALSWMKESKSKFFTYGESDLGMPIPREQAITDIEAMEDLSFGEGTVEECDEKGGTYDSQS